MIDQNPLAYKYTQHRQQLLEVQRDLLQSRFHSTNLPKDIFGLIYPLVDHDPVVEFVKSYQIVPFDLEFANKITGDSVDQVALKKLSIEAKEDKKKLLDLVLDFGQGNFYYYFNNRSVIQNMTVEECKDFYEVYSQLYIQHLNAAHKYINTKEFDQFRSNLYFFQKDSNSIARVTGYHKLTKKITDLNSLKPTELISNQHQEFITRILDELYSIGRRYEDVVK